MVIRRREGGGSFIKSTPCTLVLSVNVGGLLEPPRGGPRWVGLGWARRLRDLPLPPSPPSHPSQLMLAIGQLASINPRAAAYSEAALAR